MVEVEVLGVSDGAAHPVVLLRHEDRVLPIVVGLPEAQAIQVGLMEEKLGRPMTHDLVCNLLAGLRGELQSVTIYKLENDTFFAHLNVNQKGAAGEVEQVLRIDSRPSDGIAIAVRTKCPIFVSDEVMDAAAQDVGIVETEEPEDEEPGEDET
jgi:bifunctional DNase/RNase